VAVTIAEGTVTRLWTRSCSTRQLPCRIARLILRVGESIVPIVAIPFILKPARLTTKEHNLSRPTCVRRCMDEIQWLSVHATSSHALDTHIYYRDGHDWLRCSIQIRDCGCRFTESKRTDILTPIRLSRNMGTRACSFRAPQLVKGPAYWT
jgi:hypothetical protein